MSCYWTILCFIAGFTFAAAQLTTVGTNNDDSSRISGIKYVAPLNSVAGYANKTERDEKYQCYRCNRFKGGGAACPETQRQIPGNNVPVDAPPAQMIVYDCEVCLKVFTTVYFRNKDYIADKFISQSGQHFERNCSDSCPFSMGQFCSRWPMDELGMTVTSRACIEDKKDARLMDGCITETANGGSVKRCYCTGHLCNGGITVTYSFVLLAVAVLATLFMYQ